MKFGPMPVGDALVGAILAHSVRLPEGVLKKGASLGDREIAMLRNAGVSEIVVALLEPGDLDENAAAAQIGDAIGARRAEAHLRVSAPFTGRVNLYAEAQGVLKVDEEAVFRANAVDEAITLATLPNHARVVERQMLATVKIIPYAASAAAVTDVTDIVRGPNVISVAPVRARRARLICTRTPGMKDAVIEKGADAVRARLAALGVELTSESVTAHETAALAQEIAGGPEEDLILVLAGSATSDRRDVAPAAIERAGGWIERLGMPVDPGNLLVLGHLGETPVIGLPGCARSPKLNGADWVLERLACGLTVSATDIAAMGVGGLLKEISSRPQPRGGGALAPERPFVSLALLAAGASSRMGEAHKLLLDAGGKPLVRRVTERLLASGADEVVVVVGAESGDVRAALSGLAVRILENPEWSEGMASSIRIALQGVSPKADAVMISLADMPEVDGPLVDRLIAAFDPEEGRAIVRPLAASGRPGHPVLFGRRFFEALSELKGDEGARAVVREHSEFVTDVQTASDAPEIDLDTPEAWAAWSRSNL
ncbi:MAG: molybdopterin-binding/glycosyltransferase family 2 protein [Pseudomonadota bacterium]